MRNKQKRIFAIVLILAIALTTVLSTVAAFADEVDDDYDYSGWGYGSDIDYSQIRASQTSFTVTQSSLNSATVEIPLTGVPYGASLSWYDLDNITSSNAEISAGDSDINDNVVSIYLDGQGTTTLSFTVGTQPISVTVTVIPKYDFSNVKLNRTSALICDKYGYGGSSYIGVSGMPAIDDDDYEYLYVSDINSSNSDIYPDIYYDRDSQKLRVDASGSGSATVTFTFCGKQFTINVTVISISLKGTDFRLSPGKTAQIVIEGNLDGYKPKYKSLSPKVATVSSSGKVKAKKNGTAVIRVSVGDMTAADSLGAVINVASQKKINAFNWARRYASKNKYSQPKRMQKGYYDCSSLVWRAYHSQGITLVNKNWAPTAADLGKALVSKGRKVGNATYNNYNARKFQVGDLFFETGENNGRYKGIYHVEMFGGYTFGGFDENGKPNLITTYAARGNGYGYDADCFLCRP